MALVLLLVAMQVSAASAALVATETKIMASDAAAADLFAPVSHSVGASGDTAVEGTYLNRDAGTSSGSAYIFQRDATTWVEQTKLTASDGKKNVFFGFSASISGDTAVIGVYQAGGRKRGQAYVYRWDGSAWNEEPILTASDASASANALFGKSVNIDGNRINSGAPAADSGSKFTDAVYVYQWSGTTWTEEIKLTTSDATKDDKFAKVVCIHGSVAVLGASQNDEAARNATLPTSTT